MIDEALKERLDADLNANRVLLRDAGRGRMVPYLEGWDVIACANDVFGYDGWSYEVLEVKQAGIWERSTGRTAILYQAVVHVEALGASRTDIGTSVTSDETPEAHDTAMKGAVTDGLKRALRTFGTQFGNTLYDKGGAPEDARDVAAPGPSRASSGDNINNIGALLTWALTNHQLTKDKALAAAGVKDASDIKDFATAKANIERTVAERAAAATA